MRFATLIGPDLKDLLREEPESLREVLEEVHPEDIADILVDFEPAEASHIVANLPPDIAASIFERIDEPHQLAILETLDKAVAARLVGQMSADDRADLVQELPPEERGELLAQLAPEEAQNVRELTQYAVDSAGGLMTTDIVTVTETMTIREVIQVLRARADKAETLYYVYVVHAESNEEAAAGPRKLLGVASLRDMLLGEPDQRMSEVMTENVISVPADLHQEEVAKTIAKYDLSTVPVVDKFGRLLGVITVDDVIDVLREEQTEDVQKLAGVEPVEQGYFDTGFWRYISARSRWLVALFFGELFTSTALSRYEDAFQAVKTLVLFIPLVISSGGNSGSQSATLVIRGMAVNDIRDRDVIRVLRRELGQGLVLGLMLGAFGFLRSLLWRPRVAHQFQISCTVGITLVIVVTLGCVVGSGMPMLLKRLGFDPAVSSTPFIASLVDVLGIVAYFNVAKMVLGAIIH